jgi:ABC-type Zn uptake system ZnuABC Zn-binding protein ZnuA
MSKRIHSSLLIPLILFSGLLATCGGEAPENDRPILVASTTIVGDVVTQVAGDHFQVQVLLPIGGDPHSYQPTPQDLVAIEDAQVVFVNGFGLEESLGELIENSASEERIVEVSEGVTPLYFGESAEEHEAHAEDEDHHHEGIDPHVWMAPQNVHVWVDNIAAALSVVDPAHGADYQTNALAYREELDELHQWALESFAEVPEAQRLLVSDHATFNYLAQAYGLEVVGTLTGFSSLSESSAQELAALEDTIRELGVPAIFVSTTVPPGLAERVAEDTGVQVVRVYTGSLSEPDGPAASYLEMMRSTILLMVAALNE